MVPIFEGSLTVNYWLSLKVINRSDSIWFLIKKLIKLNFLKNKTDLN